MSTPLISVVFGTLNRLPFVKRALASIFPACGKLTCEVIVVDGGSTDGTLEYLAGTQKNMRNSNSDTSLQVIEQRERLGAVAAFNAGFRAARGTFVANFNDDAEYIGKPLAHAAALLERDAHVGQVAIPFWTCKVSDAAELEATPEKTCARHGVKIEPRVQVVRTHLFGEMPYANFGVIRRALGEQVGWWGDYWQYGGDTELSVKVAQAGYRVAPLDVRNGSILHYEVQDDTRRPNREQAQFNARWRPQAHGGTQVRASGHTGAPAHMRNPVLLEYTGRRHGSVKWQRAGSHYEYSVGAQDPQFWADAADVEWLLARREKGRACFRAAN